MDNKLKLILIIAASVILGALVSYLLLNNISKSDKSNQINKQTNRFETEAVTKLEKAITTLNNTLKSDPEAINAKDEGDFARKLAKIIRPASVQNFWNTTGSMSSTFSAVEIQKYNFYPYYKKPSLTTNDQIMFILYKYEPQCKTVDLENPVNSSCLIIVDINGIKNPNIKDADFNTTDRYDLIIDGSKNNVLLSKKYMNLLKSLK